MTSRQSSRPNSRPASGSRTDETWEARDERQFSAHEFDITLPDAWESETIYRLEGPESGGRTPQITVQVVRAAGEMTAVDLAQTQAQIQGQAGERWSRREARFLELDGGRRAYWVVVSRVENDGPTIIQDQLYVVEAGTGYRMTVTHARDRRARHPAAVEKLFQSFEPDPADARPCE